MAGTVDVYLTYDGKRIYLPVPPESIEVDKGINNNTVEVIGLGEILEPGYANLKTLSIESFFPNSKNLPYVQPGSFLTPRQYMIWIEAWIATKKPARLIVTGLDTINLLVSPTDFKYEHRGGEHEDMYFTLDLSEYRDYSPKTVTIASGGGNQGSTSTNRGLTVGAECIVNGRLHRDSFGSAPGLTERNARRVITHIANGRPYPIHVALLGGTSSESTRFSHWRGWVTRESITLV